MKARRPLHELRGGRARIGIVMLSALGDAVHVLPVVNALKRSLPDARITWVIQPLPHRLVHNHAAVDEFVVFQRRRGVSAWRGFEDFRRQVAGRRFDILLCLQVYLKAGLLAGMMDAEVKLGFDRARARDGNWLFTNRRIPARPTQHVQDQYFEFLEHLAVNPRPVRWDIPITEEERDAQREFFERIEGPACAVVVGTSKAEKNWEPARYARLLEIIELDFGVKPVLVGGPSRIERAAADRILEQTRASPVDMLGNDLRRLVWLLDGSALAVSPDTGPLHIARALDRPVVGLYGYTNPKRYGPYGKYGELVVDGYARYPGEFYRPSMEYRPDGMGRVGVEDVASKVELALREYVFRGL